MSKKQCMRCLVSGKVQGVWYRAYTENEAKKRGITGWVRNLNSGQVEVLACGEEEDLQQLFDCLKQGPKKAIVDQVVREALPWQDFDGFAIH